MIHLCPECKQQVSQLAQNCPNCGHPFTKPEESIPHEKPASNSGLWLVAGGVGLVCLILILGFIFIINKQPPQTAAASAKPSAEATRALSENELKAKQMELEIERLKLEQAKLKNQPANKIIVQPNAAPAVNITESELRNLDCRSLWILRNTIYARYGRIFSDPEVRSYFNQQDWYQPNSQYHDGLLTSSEKTSAAKIMAVEKQFSCL
ncbi:MAG: YARHG domain-containing protein [Candidatus Sericytochromatia bacterium]